MIKYFLIIAFFMNCSIAFARGAAMDSLIQEIKTSFSKYYDIEQTGTGKVALLEYSASIFRKSTALSSADEISYRSKKYGYVVNVGKYYKRIAFGVYDFNDSEKFKKSFHNFLEGHEVNPQKFYKEGKHPALSPPFLVLIQDSTLLFFYAKCEDIPKKKEWDKITNNYIKLFRKHFPSEGEVIRCYCSGPVFIINK